jgi:hypothetical protein
MEMSRPVSTWFSWPGGLFEWENVYSIETMKLGLPVPGKVVDAGKTMLIDPVA